MEPILAKADNYSFLKKLVENVKETKDVQAPDDEEANKVKRKDAVIPSYQLSSDWEKFVYSFARRSLLKSLNAPSTPAIPEKFENTALFLRLSLPSTLIRHENRAFQKRSSKRRNLKTPVLRFSVDGKHFGNRAFRKRWLWYSSANFLLKLKS